MGFEDPQDWKGQNKDTDERMHRASCSGGQWVVWDNQRGRKKEEQKRGGEWPMLKLGLAQLTLFHRPGSLRFMSTPRGMW